MKKALFAVSRILLAGSLLLVLPAALPEPSLGGKSAAERAELGRISDALNAIHTMEGRFVQIGPEGQVDQGRFYIEKPGRMRFEYAPPNPTLIVSDGRWVAVQNRSLGTVDRYALWTTPLDLILGDDVDLRDNNDITAVDEQNGALVVRARSHSGRVNGNISLVFQEPSLALKQWTVRDAQGLLTTVTIADVKTGAPLDAALFVIPAASPKRRSSAGLTAPARGRGLPPQ